MGAFSIFTHHFGNQQLIMVMASDESAPVETLKMVLAEKKQSYQREIFLCPIFNHCI